MKPYRIRSNGKSVQQILNLKPNISTFGKCFGGGLPIGIIALKKPILNKIKRIKPKVFFGGTFLATKLLLI